MKTRGKFKWRHLCRNLVFAAALIVVLLIVSAGMLGELLFAFRARNAFPAGVAAY